MEVGYAGWILAFGPGFRTGLSDRAFGPGLGTGLGERAWGAIEPVLPKNQPGARRVDDRRVISGREEDKKSIQ